MTRILLMSLIEVYRIFIYKTSFVVDYVNYRCQLIYRRRLWFHLDENRRKEERDKLGVSAIRNVFSIIIVKVGFYDWSNELLNVKPSRAILSCSDTIFSLLLGRVFTHFRALAFREKKKSAGLCFKNERSSKSLPLMPKTQVVVTPFFSEIWAESGGSGFGFRSCYMQLNSGCKRRRTSERMGFGRNLNPLRLLNQLFSAQRGRKRSTGLKSIGPAGMWRKYGISIG